MAAQRRCRALRGRVPTRHGRGRGVLIVGQDPGCGECSSALIPSTNRAFTPPSRGAPVGVGRGISRLYEPMMRRVRGTMATQFSVQTIDALFDRPVFVTTDVVRRSGIPRPIAVRVPRVLQKQGILATV